MRTPDRYATSRRQFLQAGVATCSSLLCAKKLTATARAAAQRKVQVGAHVWVYAAPLPQYDVTPVLPQIFADLKYAGLDGVELMHNVLRDADTVKRIQGLTEEYALSVIGTSFSGAMWNRDQHQAVLEDAEGVIGHLAGLGGTTLGLSVGRAPQKKSAAQLDAQAEVLRKIRGMAQRQGIVANLHNHTYEVVDDLHDLRGTLARIPDFKLGPDLNWLVRGGVDPAQFIRQYGQQIVFLHLRDQTRDGRWSQALGEGHMDYAAIAQALREIDFSGHAVIELAHEAGFQRTRPLRESWKMSRTFVRQVLGY